MNTRHFLNENLIYSHVIDSVLIFILIMSWCSLLLEFLENSWKLEIFFQGPRKLLENQIISLYSWNIVEKFLSVLFEKMFSVPSYSYENQGECLGEFESGSVKTREAVDGFYLLEDSSKLCRGFHQAMRARKTCFISFIKLIFFVVTKRKTIYEARMYTLISFYETVNSYNLETANHIILTSFLCFTALWKHTCWPIKTHVLSKLFYKNKTKPAEPSIVYFVFYVD